MHKPTIAIAALAAGALTLTIPTGAYAQPVAAAVTPTTLTTAVKAPYNLAVTKNLFLVADGDNHTVSNLAHGKLTTLVTAPATGDVAGVDVSRDGKTIAYTTTDHPSEEENANGALHLLKGKTTTTVDLAAYEKKKNPDKVNSYGVKNPSACVATALEKVTGEPASYKGQNDSHPYSVTAYGSSSWLVADAGGNDLLKVTKSGKVSTVAVLPAQSTKITADLAAQNGIKDTCVIGVTYRSEPVPTDVEVKGKYAYVSTLSGGIADGTVYRVNLRNGHSKRIATGLTSATNLAIYKGKIYVAELFTGQVAVIKNGKPKLYATVPGALSIEAGRGHLYVGTGVAGPGSVVRLR